MKIDVVAMANDGAVAPDSEAVDGDVAMTTAEEAGHVTQSTNQISESKSADNLSVSSLLTQPEGSLSVCVCVCVCVFVCE